MLRSALFDDLDIPLARQNLESASALGAESAGCPSSETTITVRVSATLAACEYVFPEGE